MDEDDQMAAEAHQQELEARSWQEEQMRREAEAFDRLMDELWATLHSQWRTEQTNLTERLTHETSSESKY